MRRPLFTALVLSLGLLVGTQARAATYRGTQGPDRLNGSAAADTLLGLAGNDILAGRGGPDVLSGGPGDDGLAAEGDGARDQVACGTGRDVVTAELADLVALDCEVVSRQLSRDVTTDFEAQHLTQVEPDSFSFGATIVTVFQSGRLETGGAAAIGFATSRDAGATWHSGLLPTSAEVVSDPVVAFDARHGVWLAATISEAEDALGLSVSRSTDGIRWGTPVAAAADPTERLDKEWIACDNWAASPYRGHCYLSYLDFARDSVSTRRSSDGGLTWSKPVAVPALTHGPAIANGPQPVIRPDGSLLVPYTIFAASNGIDEIAAVRSTDGGVTFTGPARVARLVNEDVTGMRAPPFVSADVDAAGTIYVAWSDSRFRDEASADDIVLARSPDGLRWSEPVRVPIADEASATDVFTPGLAVDTRSSGATARIAITYYSLPQEAGCAYLLSTCAGGVEAGTISTTTGGATWSAPQRLSARRMNLLWIADGAVGQLLGDYISTSYVRGRPVPVFALASPPVGGELRQAIFATTRTG